MAAAAVTLGALPALANEAAGEAGPADTAAVRENMEAADAAEITAAEEVTKTAGSTDTEEAAQTAGTEEPTGAAELTGTPETADPTEAPEPTETPGAADPTEVSEPTGTPGTADPTEAPEPTGTPGAAEPTEAPEPTGTPEGEVAYVISIPSTVDLGTLNQSEPAGGAVTVQSVSVEAKTIEGLSEGGSIAVYVRDETSGGADFRLYGADTSNSGKSLSYSILIDGQPAGERSDSEGNGCLVAAFHKAGEKAVLDIQFDQSQLPAENLSQWEGSYTGNLRFYTKQVGGNGNDQGGA